MLESSATSTAIIIDGRDPRRRRRRTLRIGLLAVVLALVAKCAATFGGAQRRYISSISTVIGGQRVHDGALLLWSVAMFAPPRTKVFVATDKPTAQWFEKRMPALMKRLDIRWFHVLDAYDMSLKRGDMIKAGVWSDLQMEKARVAEYALTHVNDTLVLDADCLVVSPMSVLPASSGAQLALAPHYITPADSREFGYFNGGLVWTNQASVPGDWIAAARKSRYYDQTALEDLAEWYRTYVFGPETDVGWWRIKHGDEDEEAFWRHFALDSKGRITFRGKAVDTLHAHFLTADDGNSVAFAKRVLRLMKQSRRYAKLLEIVEWGSRGFEDPVPQLAVSYS